MFLEFWEGLPPSMVFIHRVYPLIAFIWGTRKKNLPQGGDYTVGPAYRRKALLSIVAASGMPKAERRGCQTFLPTNCSSSPLDRGEERGIRRPWRVGQGSERMVLRPCLLLSRHQPGPIETLRGSPDLSNVEC